MGASAGTLLGTRSIHTTNDMPIVYPTTFFAIGIVGFNLNAHFIDKSMHPPNFGGETREQRIAEFHEHNDAPVSLMLMMMMIVLAELRDSASPD